MSANHDSTDPSYRIDLPSYSRTRARESGSGMGLTPTRLPIQLHLNETSSESPNMSTIALRAPSFMLPSPRDMSPWDDRRPQGLPSRPRSQTSQSERIELPSIRQAVPEIQRSFRAEPEDRIGSTTHSPTAGPRSIVSSSEYAQSSATYKRRRLSSDEELEIEARERAIPRLYQSPPPKRPHSATVSPTISGRRLSTISSVEPWSKSARTSPYVSARSLHPSPPPFDSTGISRSEWRPTLPSLPSLTLDRNASQVPRPRGGSGSEYALESTRLGAQTYPQVSKSAFDLPPQPTSSCQPPAFTYGYQQPRGQSFSGPSTSHPISQDRTPFSSNQHTGYPGGSFPYGVEMSELSSESKQRKRRGNLPKETTDKLRAWFVAHLQHPYPTEDEKQELMRQTGLQMNQISNWFINARRRQLPTMINNARVESDARSARVGESTIDYAEERKKNSPLLGDSDGEGSLYDDEFGGFGGRPAAG